MTAEITKQIDHIASKYLGPCLRVYDFKRTGRCFRSLLPECTLVIEIQGRKYNQRDRGQFTVNLGVYHPGWISAVLEIPALSKMIELSEKPHAYQCLVSERLDYLAFKNPDGTYMGDDWWDISPEIPIEQTGKSVVDAVEKFGIKWLQSMSSLDAAVVSKGEWAFRMKNTWRDKILSMVGYELLGDGSQAAKMYHAAVSENYNQDKMTGDILAWAIEKNLPLSVDSTGIASR